MHLSRLETTDGHLRDTPLELSSGLNCIIGARGTCKSTIVETIRFLFDDDLGRVSELLSEADGGDGASHRGLVRATLRGGTARLETHSNTGAGDRKMVIERDVGSQPRVYVDGVKSVDEPGFLSEIEIYSQGELQEIATSPAKRLALVDRPHKSALDQWREEAAGLADRIAELGPQIRELREAIDSSKRTLQEGAPLRQQLAEAQAGRPQMSPEMAEHRARYQRREQFNRVATELVTRYEEAFRLTHDAVEELATAAARSIELRHSDSSALGELAASLGEARETASSLFDSLPTPDVLHENLAAARAESAAESAAYYEILKQEEAVTEAIKLEDRLSQEVTKIEGIEAELATRERRLATIEGERIELRRRLKELRTKIFHRRLDEVERINSEFSDNIVLALNHGTHTETYRTKLDEMLAGSRLRDRGGLCKQVAAALPPDALVSLVDADDAEGMAAVLNRDAGQMMRLISHLSETDALYRLEREVADDELEITMFVEGVPRSVAEMSKGQKATAILPLLLRPAGYPLVLDQPEDDLDNRFIFDTLVKKLQELKWARQLIFVTHNANIPVIGNAERVFVMTMDGPTHAQLEGVGTVDEMREQIVSLLEGGREAFELRSQTYGFSDATGQ